MARVKVTAYDTDRPIVVEEGATKGATLGVNLFNADGTVLDAASLAALVAAEQGAVAPAEQAPILWDLIVGVPIPPLYDSTGLLDGGALSINGGDNTKFDVSQCIVGYVDYTDPTQPLRTTKTLGPYTAQTVDDLTTQLATYVGIDPVNEVLVQQATPFTPQQRRSLVSLGLLVHSNLTNLNAVNTIASTNVATLSQFHDYLQFRGPFKQGIEYGANGANLKVNRSGGVVFKFGSNFQTDPENPHEVSISGQTALTFRYRTQSGEVSGDITDINPTQYDVGGTLTAVPTNDWTVQRITVFQSGLTRIQYGQATYAKYEDALAGFQSEPFVTEPNIAENGIFCGWLFVKQSATALNNPAQARFINALPTGVPASPSVVLASTDDLAEGSVNLYFTEQRARDAVDGDVTALSIASGVVNIDLSLGKFFTLLLTANVTSITFSNLPASGKPGEFAVRIRQDGTGGWTVALPSSFKATGGSDTAVAAAANAYTLLTALTFDQGTRWEYAMQEIAA